MEQREWTCLLLCSDTSGKIEAEVTVKVTDLNDHFYKSDNILVTKSTSMFFGRVWLKKIFDREGDQEIIHYCRNNPSHISGEIKDLVRDHVKPIYVV